MQYGSSFNRSIFYNDLLFQNRISRSELEDKIVLPDIQISNSQKIANLKLKLVSTDIIIGYMNFVASQIPRIFSEQRFKLSEAVLSHDRLRTAFASIVKDPDDTREAYFKKFDQVLLSYYPEMLKVYRQFPTVALKDQLIDYYEQLSRKFTRSIALALLQIHPDTMDYWLRKKESSLIQEVDYLVESRKIEKPIDLASESIQLERKGNSTRPSAKMTKKDDNGIPFVKIIKLNQREIDSMVRPKLVISLNTTISEICRHQKIVQNLANNGITTLHMLFAIGQRNIQERGILNDLQISELNDAIKTHSEYYWHFFKKIEQAGFTTNHTRALLKFGVDSVYELLKLTPDRYLQIIESIYPHKQKGNSGVANKSKEMQQFKQTLLNVRTRELIEKRITL
jgi:hypothetical protein